MVRVKALKRFEGILDSERNVFPKENDEWETSEERAELLEKKGVAKRIHEKMDDIDIDNMDIDDIDKLETIKKIEELEDKKTEKPKRRNKRMM